MEWFKWGIPYRSAKWAVAGWEKLAGKIGISRCDLWCRIQALKLNSMIIMIFSLIFEFLDKRKSRSS